MSNLTAVARTAPIAIAPKPAPTTAAGAAASRAGAAAYRQDSFSKLDLCRQSSSVLDTFRAAIPCQSCQQSRTQCIMSDEDDSCIPCQVKGEEECSLVSSPQPRKRKLNGESPDDPVKSKRR